MGYIEISLLEGTFWGYLRFSMGGIDQMKAFIVWNETKTQGFVTTDHQLAYEARKGSGGNCYDENGLLSTLACAFVEEWSDGNCTIEEIEVAERLFIYDMIGAAQAGVTAHPQTDMQNLGFGWLRSEPQPISDAWGFYCDKMPAEWPPYIRERKAANGD